MQNYKNNFQDINGTAISGASIFVYTDSGRTTLATVFSDNGITPTANPVSSDSSGEFGFYAANGRYYLTAIKAGVLTQLYNDVLLFDPADASAVSAASVSFAPSGTGGGSTDLQTRGRNVVYVTDFYANGSSGVLVDPTGTTDSTSGIQNAINAVNTAGGGAVVFPPGTYKISGTLVVYRGITLQGSGKRTTVISQTADATAIRCDQTTDGECRDIRLCDFKVSSTLTSPSSTTYGINLVGVGNNAQNVTLERLWVTSKFNIGVRIKRPILTVIRSVLSENHSAEGFLIIGDGTSVICENSWAQANGTIGWHFQGAISYSGLQTCASDTNGSHGYLFEASTAGGTDWPFAIALHACGSESNTGDGFQIIDGEQYTLNACRAFSSGGDGIHIDGGRGVVLNAFKASSNTGWAINTTTSATPKIPGDIVAEGCSLSGNTAGRISNAARVMEVLSTEGGNGVVFVSAVTFASDNTNNIGASGANRPATIFVGTGVNTPLVQAPASTALTLGANAGTNWQIDTNGHYKPSANNSSDVGGSGARVRTAYIATSVDTGGSGNLGLNTNFGATQARIIHTASANRTVDLTGSNGGNPAIGASAGSLNVNSALQLSTLGAFASGDKYLVVDASGNVHVSAIGPAS